MGHAGFQFESVSESVIVGVAQFRRSLIDQGGDVQGASAFKIFDEPLKEVMSHVVAGINELTGNQDLADFPGVLIYLVRRYVVVEDNLSAFLFPLTIKQLEPGNCSLF